MSNWITVIFFAIMPSTYDCAIAYRHRTYRNISDGSGSSSFMQRLTHPLDMVIHQQRL
jgi:hypothetical protein